LENEHVVRVVVDVEPLRAARRGVRVRLHAAPERVLEQSAEDGERMPVDVERLQDDRGARLPLGDHAGDVRGASERGSPRDVRRIGADGYLAALSDEPESRVPDRGGADEALDVRL